jgi:hypothetical protein
MLGMQITAIALQGLNQAQSQVEQAGRQLASIGAETDPGSSDAVSLSDAAVSLISGKNQFATALKLVQAADEMERQTINLMG